MKYLKTNNVEKRLFYIILASLIKFNVFEYAVNFFVGFGCAYVITFTVEAVGIDGFDFM